MSEKDISMKLEQYARELENDPEFIAEKLSMKIVEEMLGIMEKRGLTQTWLAEKMGVSKAHISRILNAPPNMTLLTVAKIACALGTKPDVYLDSSKVEDQIPWNFSVKIKENMENLNLLSQFWNASGTALKSFEQVAKTAEKEKISLIA